MDEGKQIDLQPGEYRQAFNGPLANPRALLAAAAIFLVAALVAACTALWVKEAWWLVFCPIPMAMSAGAALAGLWPDRVFGNGSKKDPIA